MSYSPPEPYNHEDDTDDEQDVDYPAGVERKQTQQPQDQEDNTDDHEQIEHIHLLCLPESSICEYSDQIQNRMAGMSMSHPDLFPSVYLTFSIESADICFSFPIQVILPSEETEYTSFRRRVTPASVLLTLKLEHK
jgi:hypothetical protein